MKKLKHEELSSNAKRIIGKIKLELMLKNDTDEITVSYLL